MLTEYQWIYAEDLEMNRRLEEQAEEYFKAQEEEEERKAQEEREFYEIGIHDEEWENREILHTFYEEHDKFLADKDIKEREDHA